jgi:hypothetical protein
MKGKEKPLLERFKQFWETGKKISEDAKKIGFCLKTYAVNQIFIVYKKNNASLKESEKKEFEGWVRELASEKKLLGPDAICTAEEYSEFLQSSFNNVDDEDRNGEVTVTTSYNFKLLGDLIDVLTQWGPIPDEWQKKSKNIKKLNIFKILEKYSKFKALDIFKCLKQGIAPKRGGPKEADDEVSKELNDMMKENKDISNESNNKDKIFSVETNILNEMKNVNINSFEDKITIPGQVDLKNYKDNSNINNYPKTNNLNNKISPINFEKPTFADNINIDDHIKDNKKFLDSKSVEKKPDNSTTKNSDVSKKDIKPSHGNIKVVNVNKEDLDKNSPNFSDDLEAKKNLKSSMLLGPDYKVDNKITSRKMDFNLPVKYRTLEYFRLIDTINKIMETAGREIDSNKVEKSLLQMELALYYLHNIEK